MVVNNRQKSGLIQRIELKVSIAQLLSSVNLYDHHGGVREGPSGPSREGPGIGHYGVRYKMGRIKGENEGKRSKRKNRKRKRKKEREKKSE